MATAIILLVLIVVCVVGIKSYSKKLAHGCCGAGGDVEEKIKVQDQDPSHYPNSTTVQIEGMTCSHCKQRVENAFNAEEGVWAQVDLGQGTALVRSKSPLEERALCKLVSRAGYRVTAINGEPPKFVV